MSTPRWRPDPARPPAMAAFAQRVGLPADYAALWEWSVRERGAFWRAIWEQCDVRGTPGDVAVVDGDRMPGARWFPGAELSYAENVLRRRDDAAAIYFTREDGLTRTLSFAELFGEVARLRDGLARLGLGPGDRVAAFLPNAPEAMIAALAVASLGAVWSSCSPDFGVAGGLDRFAQVEPRLLLAIDGYVYKGKPFDCMNKVRELRAALPSVEHVVLVPYLDPAADAATIDTGRPWAALRTEPRAEPTFPRFPFDHPLWILFSSGTTGRPKCIVHGAGGTLLQHLKEHQLHVDLRADDTLFYATTTGWMMWNWLLTALASGCAVALHDGNPFHPQPNALWQMAAATGVSVFGTSAKYLDACKKEGLQPGRTHDLRALRALLSTGSPLVPESFDWVYEHVAAGTPLQVAPISGGTDIVSCFALSCPLRAVHRGEMQCRGLGMKVEVWDDDGNPVVGTPGELVCTASFPSQPLGFLGDDDGARYRAAYFEHFPGVWRHGDWAELTARDGVVIHGRSDATLNPGGVRIGTAEIYRLVEQLEEVAESVAVGQAWDGDQRVVLFVVLRAGLTLDQPLEGRIRATIRAGATPRHVPAVIRQVSDLPRTRSGKVSEIAVRDVLAGRTVHNTGALTNAGVLREFRVE
ncbi:MAG: acetoacetate--CoA ligase [Planctomycetota bacterium]